MAAKVRISRHGLSACPGCGAHIPVASDWRATHCGFCGASLLATPSKGDVLAELRTWGGKSGGAMAAALLSLGVACSDDTRALDPRDGGAGADRGRVEDSGQPDTGTQISDSGLVRDATWADADDVIPGPEYGEPPMDAGAVSDSGVIDSGSALDTGVRADTGVEPDAGDIPVPLYGLPPPDAGDREDSGEKEDSGEPVITPLYGISPPLDGGR